MTIITAVFLVAFVLAGLYCLLRFLFPKTGETPFVWAVLAFFALTLGLQNGTIALVGVIVVAVLRKPVVDFLTSCNLTRDNVETIARGIFGKK